VFIPKSQCYFYQSMLKIISCSVQTLRCCVIMFQIDYENKWFDAIPRITYTDKSTYVESQTKTYDQVLNYSVSCRCL